jgi:hypothetical protein
MAADRPAVTAELTAFAVGDPAGEIAVPGGAPIPLGQTLRELRAQLGGDEGFVEDGFGGRHPISLAPWAHADPDRTRIVIAFRTAPGVEPFPGAPLEPAREFTMGGGYRVQLTVIEDGDPAYAMPEGWTGTQGQTLRAFRARHGGDVATVRDPDGVEHEVSIAHLAGRDPDRTRVQIGFWPRRLGLR